MKATFITAALAMLASGVWWAAEAQLAAQEDAQAIQIEGEEVAAGATVEGIEVLTRGPVHEAFAEPVTLQGTETIVIEKQPPEPVEELPPDQKPEGESVIWIPGYWAWDDERADFLWISGVWRVAPPNQEWVPGYWSETDGGYAWTPGFWVSAELEEVAYLPEPPESLEEGATAPSPSDDHIWVPGVWRYQQTRYVWRPGYWVEAQPDWVWTPAHYTWCPTGYVFVDGYWDYPLARRGVLFAPVYFTQPVYTRPAYYYSPSIVINTSILTVHLFARPTYRHYYFGDYYGDRYADIGIRPWYHYHRHQIGYDPIFTYYSWREGRRDRDWFRTLERRHDYFVRNRDARPAHTFADYRRRGRGDRNRDVNIRNTDVDVNVTNITNVNIAAPLNQVATREVNFSGDGRSQVRFEKVDRDRRERIQENARELRQFTQQRRKIESGTQTEAATRDTADARQDRQRNRKTLSLADRPRSREISQRTEGRTAADTPPSTPDQTDAKGDTVARDRGRARKGREGDAVDTAGRGRERGREARDSATADTTAATDPTTDATGTDAAGARDRTSRDRARSRDTATTTDAAGATDAADTTTRDRASRERARSRDATSTTPGATAVDAAEAARDAATDTGLTRDRAGQTARDAAGANDRTRRGTSSAPAGRATDPDAGITDPAGADGREAARTTRDRARRATGSDATTLPSDARNRREGSTTESGSTEAIDALRDRRSGAAGAAGERGRNRSGTTPSVTPGRSGQKGSDTPTRSRRSTDDRSSANAVEDRLDLQRGSLGAGVGRAGDRSSRPNAVDDRLDLQRGSLGPDRNSSSTGALRSGGQGVRVNRQPLDPGAQRASPEDLRIQRPGDVRGEDDMERRRLYGVDRENRVARPGRDDRAGARGTTEAGGERSADRASGATALPSIRQPRDPGASNSDLDRSRTRPPGDVRREMSELNEDRRAFDRSNQISRPGRDSRGVGGSAPSTDRPRNRLDLPDRTRNPDRSPQSSLDRGADRPRATTALRPADRDSDRGSADRARAAARVSAQREQASAAQRSAQRDASRAAERAQSAARAERSASAERGGDRGRSAERGRSSERGRESRSNDDRKGSDDSKRRKRDRD